MVCQYNLFNLTNRIDDDKWENSAILTLHIETAVGTSFQSIRKFGNHYYVMFAHRNEFDADTKICYTDLYDRVQKVHYRVGSRDEKLELNIKVSLNVRFGFADEKILKVVITDPSNPLLLFSSKISSDIYTKLKEKLGLLIDFSRFPQQLVTLLAQCSEDKDLNAATYALCLEELNFDPYDLVEGRCILLRIMEVNQFQRLCLVALHMTCGSEREINAYLARRIGILNKQLENMNLRIQESEEKVSKASYVINKKNVELEKLKSQCNEQVHSVRHEFQEEITQLKREIESKENDCDRRVKKALREQEEKFISQQVVLQEALEKSKRDMNAMVTTISKMESELSQKSEIHEKFHNDMKILQDEILKSENKVLRLEGDAKEKNAFVVSLKQRIVSLEKDKEDKDKAIKKLTSMLETSDSQKNVIKATLKDKLQTLETQKSDLSMMRKDLLKANEIIAKLNKEVCDIQAKLSERCKIVLEQEKVIGELRQSMSCNEDNSNQKNGRLKELEEENTKLISDLKENEEQLRLKDEVIQKNQRVIGWLQETVCKLETKCKTSPITARIPTVPINPMLVNKKLSQLTNNGVASRSKPGTASRKPLNMNNFNWRT